MSTSFAAHVITAEAVDLGDPVIIVTICDSESREEHLIADYPISDADYPISDGEDAADLLWEHGWRILDDPSQAGVGYDIVTVEPADYEQIVRHVTFARDRARVEHERRDTAWRAIIRHAMHDNASATALAKAAGISRERIYQIRDNRR
jgi:hypothetical protein